MNRMVRMKYRQLAYGIVLVGLVVGGLAAAVIDVSTFSQEINKDFRIILLQLLPINWGMVALITLLEFALPAAGPRKPLKGYILNFNIGLLGSLAGVFLTSMAGTGVVLLGGLLGLGWIDLRFSAGHGLGAVLAAFLLSQFIWDFFYYWLHRLQHESPVLWQEHKLHHMDEQLCALTSLRQHWLDSLLIGSTVTIPMAILFKLDPIQGTIGASLSAVWAAFVHANIRLHLGPASVFLGNPQLHRIHHSRVREHHDRNYAPFCPIWDVLFGTYQHPKPDEYPLTGVHNENEVAGFVAAATLPFREWRKMFREWRLRGKSGSGLIMAPEARFHE
jgi:sterol desaturase/sphingolipid hydroxylase (fatty acid hydroxylase superfamily)